MEKIKDHPTNSNGQPHLHKDAPIANILAKDRGNLSSTPTALTSRHKADPM